MNRLINCEQIDSDLEGVEAIDCSFVRTTANNIRASGSRFERCVLRDQAFYGCDLQLFKSVVPRWAFMNQVSSGPLANNYLGGDYFSSGGRIFKGIQDRWCLEAMCPSVEELWLSIKKEIEHAGVN